MFLRYYKLREQPFGMTPDHRYLYLSTSHREALASLIYGIETGRGFVSLIAEPGMGKTTVLFQLMERLRNSARTVFLFQTQGDTHEFLSNLIADLGLDPSGRDVGSLQRQLNEILIQETRLGRRFVLVIDEAQNLGDSVLESVRMLSNFETSRSKLMQIVLAGQPPLADKLARPALEQLRQRVSIICRLKPFTEEEAVDYIGHRLKTAGHKGKQMFRPDALSIIAQRSEGIPRNINNICFHALSLGYAKGQKRIDRAIIEEVLCDLELDTLKNHRDCLREEQRKRPAPARGLEGVTLNRGRWDEGRVILRRPKYSSPVRRRAGGWRRPQVRRPHWPYWAVTLLVLVLAGEIFWAYMPEDGQRQAIRQFVASTVRQAKRAAARHDPLKTNDSPALPQMQTRVFQPEAHSNSVPESYGENASAPTGATSIEPADTNPAGTDRGESIASKGMANTHSTAVEAVPARVKLDSKETESRTADQLQPSGQVPTGTLVIQSNVAGCKITINGQRNTDWQTPHMFDLAKGTYRISVSQEGYSTWFKVVHVTPGKKRWVIADLHLPRGVIVIDTEPPGMQVFIDGRPFGPSEVEAALSAGTHTYKVVPPEGKRPLEGSFVLKPGDILTRKIRWLPSAGQPTAINQRDTRKLRNIGNSMKESKQS